MPDPNARLTVRMTAPLSSHDADCIRLVIEDVPSGQEVVQLELRGDDLVNLLAHRLVGGTMGLPAWLVEPKNRVILGLRRLTTTRRFSTQAYSDEQIADWSKVYAAAAGAHGRRTHKNNSGQHVVNWTFYTNADAEDEVERLTEAFQATMGSLPAPAAESA